MLGASDIIAVISLIASGFAIWYGYKAYRAQYKPKIHPTWLPRRYRAQIDPGGPPVISTTRIQMTLTNLSTAVALHDVSARVDLLYSNGPANQSVLYCSFTPDVIPPGDKAIQRRGDPDEALDTLIARCIPGMLAMKTVDQAGTTPAVNVEDPADVWTYQGRMYYEVNKTRPVTLQLTVSYTPGVADAKPQTIVQKAELTPDFVDIPGRGSVLANWNVRRLQDGATGRRTFFIGNFLDRG